MELKFNYKVPPTSWVDKFVCEKALASLSSINSEWDSLYSRQYIALMGVLNSDLELEDQLIQATYILMEQPWNPFVAQFIEKFLTIQQIQQCAELCQFIFNKDRPLSENHVQHIKIGKTRYIGPLKNLADITFSQFMDVDHILTHTKELSQNDFAKIAAILYLPKGEIYSHLNNQKRIPLFLQQSKNVLYGITFFFTSIKQKWVRQLPNLFLQGSENESGAGNWAEPLEAISSDPVNMKDNANQSAFNVLYYMDRKIAESKKLKNNA